jgi:AcrR family transcriptional regulator
VAKSYRPVGILLERMMNARQPRAEETRARILEAAAECFGQHGYDAASVSMVCRRAGVSKGAFYHHFSSKHELLLELLDSWLQGIDVQLDMARLGAASVPEAILSMVERAGLVFQMAEEYVPIFLEFYTKASRDPVVWQATIRPYRRYRAFFAQLIEAGIAEGSFRPTDSGVAARVLLSLAFGLLLQGLLNPDDRDWAQVATEGVRTFLKGLGADLAA